MSPRMGATVRHAIALALIATVVLVLSGEPVFGVDARVSFPAQSSDGPDDRTWFGWLSGFVGVILVLGVAAASVLVIRSKRGNPAARRSRDPSSR